MEVVAGLPGYRVRSGGGGVWVSGLALETEDPAPALQISAEMCP